MWVGSAETDKNNIHLGFSTCCSLSLSILLTEGIVNSE